MKALNENDMIAIYGGSAATYRSGRNAGRMFASWCNRLASALGVAEFCLKYL